MDHDGNTLNETCIETIIKVVVDTVDGNYFVSAMKVAKNAFVDGETTNYDLDKTRTFVCDVCLESFTTKTKVARHVAECRRRRRHSVKSTGQKSGGKHKRVHTGEKPYKCDLCSKGFSQKSHLTIHKRTHTGEKTYKCDVCSKCFSQKSDLDRHGRVHTGEKPYKCDVCPKSFSRNSNLGLHKRVHTGEKPYRCPFCSKRFSVKCNLAKHKCAYPG